MVSWRFDQDMPEPTAEHLSQRETMRDHAVEMSRHAIRDHERAVRGCARATVAAIESSAQVILYGSRARGDAVPDSNRDLLVLLPGVMDDTRRQAIYEHRFDLSLDTGMSMSPLIVSEEG